MRTVMYTYIYIHQEETLQSKYSTYIKYDKNNVLC